jgi:ribosome maturation factor RimP
MSEHLKTVVERVRQLVEPLVAREGLELVDVEYLREGGRWVLRLFIDKPGGVSLDDCQELSRQVDKLLDVEDFIETHYSLEVSSPGIERPLRTPAHYERFAGRLAEVKTFAPIGEPPRKNFKGRIVGVAGDRVVTLEADGKQFEIPLEKIAKAHLVFDFDAFESDQGPGLPRPPKA